MSMVAAAMPAPDEDVNTVCILVRRQRWDHGYHGFTLYLGVTTTEALRNLASLTLKPQTIAVDPVPPRTGVRMPGQ